MINKIHFITRALAVFCLGAMLPAALPPAQARQQDSKEVVEMQEKAAREANKRRQQEIVDDSARLLQLATQLKEAVDKSNEHLLSIEVVRKAEEVEKLAKKVKEKMKESITGPERPKPAPLPPIGR